MVTHAAALCVFGAFVVLCTGNYTTASTLGFFGLVFAVIGFVVAKRRGASKRTPVVAAIASVTLVAIPWIVLPLSLIGSSLGGAPTFPARFTLNTGTLVTLARPQAGTVRARLVVSSAFSNRCAGHVDNFEFVGFHLALNGQRSLNAQRLYHGVIQGMGSDGACQSSEWDYIYRASFPAAALTTGKPVQVTIRACTSRGVCDQMLIGLCPSEVVSGGYTSVGQQGLGCAYVRLSPRPAGQP